MKTETKQRTDRRAYARLAVPATVELEVELHGFDEEGRRVDLVGVTVNLSRGGLLARIREKLRSRAPCMGHFPRTKGRIYPEFAVGRVIRLGSEKNRYLVAVEFEKPLDLVRIDDD